MKSSVKTPIIIGIRSADNKIAKFYIAVYGILISVSCFFFQKVFQTKINVVYKFQISKEFGIVKALDLWYKIHKLFKIEPSTAVKRLMDFLDYFIFENDTVDTGLLDRQMHDLGDKLRALVLH